jgi:type VI secretion system secreted protein Hcp
MAVDMFLKISGIDGESVDSKHKGEIDVLSFSWGVSNATRQAGTTRIGSTGKTTVSDFSIMKVLDSSSPRLFEACCQGEHISDALLTLRKAGENQQEFFKIKLTDVLISSVAPGGSAGGDVGFEQVSLSFGSALIEAAKLDPKGQATWTSATTCGGSTADLQEFVEKR